VLATIPVLFLTVSAGTAYRHLFNVAGTDAEMCNSFDLKNTSYESSTIAEIAERFEPSTVLWAFHTIQPSSLTVILIANVQSLSKILSSVYNCKEKFQLQGRMYSEDVFYSCVGKEKSLNCVLD